MSNLYRGHSKDAFYQVLIHLARRFQRRFFRNQPISSFGKAVTEQKIFLEINQ
jgi:hypothetical protein